MKKRAKRKKLRGNRGTKPSQGGPKLGFAMAFRSPLYPDGPVGDKDWAQYVQMAAAAQHHLYVT